MNRRRFLATLASLPFVGKLFAQENEHPYVKALMKTRKRDLECVERIRDTFCSPDLCPLCEKPLDSEKVHLIGEYEVCRHYGFFWKNPVNRDASLRRYLAQLRRRMEMESELWLKNEKVMRHPKSGIQHDLAHEQCFRSGHKAAEIKTMIRRVEEAMKWRHIQRTTLCRKRSNWLFRSLLCGRETLDTDSLRFT